MSSFLWNYFPGTSCFQWARCGKSEETSGNDVVYEQDPEITSALVKAQLQYDELEKRRIAHRNLAVEHTKRYNSCLLSNDKQRASQHKAAATKEQKLSYVIAGEQQNILRRVEALQKNQFALGSMRSTKEEVKHLGDMTRKMKTETRHLSTEAVVTVVENYRSTMDDFDDTQTAVSDVLKEAYTSTYHDDVIVDDDELFRELLLTQDTKTHSPETTHPVRSSSPTDARDPSQQTSSSSSSTTTSERDRERLQKLHS